MPALAYDQYTRVDASDFDKAAGVLFELSRYLGNTMAPMEAAREIAIEDMQERFDTETEPSGYHWFALTDRYAKRRGSEHPILDDTGTKIKSSKDPGRLRREATNPDNFTTDGTSLWFSVDGLPDYWAVHQYGSENFISSGFTVQPIFGDKVNAKGKPETIGRNAFSKRDPFLEAGQMIPPRPFIGLSEEAEDKILLIFDKWVDYGFDWAEEEYEHSGGGVVGPDHFVGSLYTFKSGKTGYISSVGPGAGGRPQFRVKGRFGPMAT